MSAVLNDLFDGDEAGSAAQSGNLLHSAAAAFHRAAASMGVKQRTEEGLAALEAARQQFPDGDPAKARNWFIAYAGDKENQDADVPWVEQAVELKLEAATFDPTGEPIVVVGTLDQVRRARDGTLTLWDIKTGSRRTGKESLTAYAVQQATYLLAARECLADNIEPGGLIYTPGYEKRLGKRFFSYSMTVDECRLLVQHLVYTVALVRSGIPIFRPGVDTCEYCPCGTYDVCLPLYRTSYSGG